MEPSCIICYESFIGSKNIAAIKCGHFSHHECLITWIKKSKSCPECRMACTENDVFRIFFTFESEGAVIILNSKIDAAQNYLDEKIDCITKAGDQKFNQQDLLLEETRSMLKGLENHYENELQNEKKCRAKLERKFSRLEKKLEKHSIRFPWQNFFTFVICATALIFWYLKA